MEQGNVRNPGEMEEDIIETYLKINKYFPTAQKYVTASTIFNVGLH